MAPRRTLEQTRTLLLETGVSMLIDGGIGVSLDVLSLIDVCRAAGLTTAGSAYKIWANQDDFRADVLDHLAVLTPTDPETLSELTALTRSGVDEAPTLAELVRTTAAEPEPLAGGQTGYEMFSALVLASRHDERLALRIHTIDSEVLSAYADLYESLAARYDRVWVPPFDAHMLSVTFSALAEGITARSRTLEELTSTSLAISGIPGEPARSWTIYGACSEAIIEAFTRPRLPGEPGPDLEARDVDTEVALDAENSIEAQTPAPSPTRRRSLDQTRSLLLTTATDLLIGSGFDVTIGRLDLVDVSRAAGLTTAGSAYKIWATMEEYRVDLLRHLFTISLHGDETPSLVTHALETTDDDTPSLSELIRVMAADNLERNSGTSAIVTIALELASAHDPELAGQIREAELESLAEFTEVYNAAIAVYGRSWVPPFDARVLALALNALVHGFTIRGLVTPELVPANLARPTGPGGADQAWHLFACAVEAIIEAFTQPENPAAG